MKQSDENRIDKKNDATSEERENNGAEMSDARELDEKMSEEYSHGKNKGDKKLEKNEALNKKEKERTDSSKLNESEV
ncbi:MAG: hypothetical protein JST55_09700 [Bacteroidetes bacterium]|nr:hypothetical protein [Bacteroidota bacterium]